MTKYINGTIPKKVSYVYSDDRQIIIKSSTKKQISVMPAYLADPTDQKTMNKAINLASNSYGSSGLRNKPHFIDEVDNNPIDKIKVVSSYIKAESGIYYKVLAGKFYVDLREEILLDTILEKGIRRGGILNGQYIWAKVHSKLKLIRIGSEMYNLIIDYDAKRNFKPIKKESLEIGAIYKDRRNNIAIFLGLVNSTSLRKNFPISGSKSRFRHDPINKAFLFYHISDFGKFKKLSKNSKNKLIKNSNSSMFSIKKSYTYIEKIDNMELHNNIIDHLRLSSIQEIKNCILNNCSSNRQMYLDYHLESLSSKFNIYKYGDPSVELFNYEKYLTIS